MNKQSNTYTIIYIIVLVIIVGAALAFTSISLKDRQQANADADKMRQILASVRIEVPDAQVTETYSKYITGSMVVNASGNVDTSAPKAFDISIAAQVKEPADKRLLPVYECKLDDGSLKYILPMYGAGLWGPIWGYVALDADGSTIFGAYFAHQGETPGLGAEIEKPVFSGQFVGKHIYAGDHLVPVAVVKKGQKPVGGGEYVDGISGGTITSKGVGAMLSNCLLPYNNFLKPIHEKSLR